MNVVDEPIVVEGMYEAAFPEKIDEYTPIHAIIITALLPFAFKYNAVRYSFEHFEIL